MSSHSSPASVALSGVPYEGRQGNPRALLRTSVALAEVEGPGPLAPGAGGEPQSLPSLKASGLLDSWKPPAEAFANALSLQGAVPGQVGVPPPPPTQTQGQVRRTSPGQGQGVPVAASPAAAPVGLTWLADSGGARP